ncbi:MAG: hypothetical protein NC928_03395, partial [Candidatus Omnitrophica bacterium]|nr:hypothetical protein [Candidatus Omnitrophota bacterium]
MANRLETMLEKIIGKERALVKVDLKLSQPAPGTEFLRSDLRNLPGVVFFASKESKERMTLKTGIPIIENMSIIVYLDNRLPKDKVDLVKASILNWMELNFKRGDSLKIETVSLKENPPEELAIKQLSFLKRNLWVIITIASIIIFGFILFLLLFMPTRKYIKERIKIRAKEPKEMPQLETILNDIKDAFIQSAAGTNANIDRILEDIKETLEKAPSKTDIILEEIKDTLDKMIQTQQQAFASSVAPTAGPSTAATAGSWMSDFLSALKETIAPGGGVGGTELSPKILESLQKIEELIKKEVEATATATKPTDEPFKYLNSLSPREISLFIDKETPRLTAIILGHIDPDKAALIFASLPEAKKLELATAMATLVEDDEVAIEIKDFIQRKMPQVKLRADFSPIVGSKALANILSSLPYNQCIAILENMEKKNPAITEAVKNEMFLFEDIKRLDDRTIQEIVKVLDKERLALALSQTTDEIRQKFFSNMTEQAATILKEDIEA